MKRLIRKSSLLNNVDLTQKTVAIINDNQSEIIIDMSDSTIIEIEEV